MNILLDHEVTTTSNVYILQTEQYGRGIYANEFIDYGQVIELDEILPLNSGDTEMVNKTELQWYTFKFDSMTDCLVLGNGELFNHSDTPNVSYKLIKHEGRFKMLFMAIKPIQKGDQLFIDYGADAVVDPTMYTTNLLK